MSTGIRNSKIAHLVKLILRIHWPRLAAKLPGFIGQGTVLNDVVVSLTTYGPRIRTVDATIFSILRGSFRPSKLILVLDEEIPPPVKARLEPYLKMGLEILRSENLGPHKKYYPVVKQGLRDSQCLVTADDDIFYARNWLESLYRSHLKNPEDVIAGWVKEISMQGSSLAPYQYWRDVSGTHGAAHHFAIGCAGILYPPSMVAALAERGDRFKACCPRADDVWLHATAVSTGHRIRQVTPELIHPVHLPGTQETGLKITNHLPDGNDKAARATYTQAELARIRASVDDLKTEA